MMDEVRFFTISLKASCADFDFSDTSDDIRCGHVLSR